MRYRLVVLLLAGAMPLGGCGPSDGVGGDPGAAFPGRAAAVAAAWQAATAQSADWKSRIVALQALTVAGAGKLPDDARFRAAAALPRETPSPATIALPEGSTTKVPLVSAAAAFGELERAGGAGPCEPGRVVPASGPPSADPLAPVAGPAAHTCTAVTVTGATLGTVGLRTNRGLLPVPAWLFTVDSAGAVPSPVARVAVEPAALGVPPQAEIPQWGEPDVATVDRLVRAEPRRIEFTIGVSACSSDAVGYVHETGGVVVLGGWAAQKPGPCIGALKLVPVIVTLNEPLAARPLLDSVSGRVLL